jgi:hypothetical protein
MLTLGLKTLMILVMRVVELTPDRCKSKDCCNSRLKHLCRRRARAIVTAMSLAPEDQDKESSQEFRIREIQIQELQTDELI